MPRKESTTFAQMGMAALLPGMTHMLELMQGELERMRAMIEGVQSASQELKRGPGRPPSMAREKKSNAALSGWSKFTTPEARSREMLRRRAVRAAKAKKAAKQKPQVEYERLSVAGLERGSDEYKKIDAENKRRFAAARRKAREAA